MKGKGLTAILPAAIPTTTDTLGKRSLPQYNRENLFKVNIEIIFQTKAFILVARIRFCNADGIEIETFLSKLTLCLCRLLDFPPDLVPCSSVANRCFQRAQMGSKRAT